MPSSGLRILIWCWIVYFVLSWGKSLVSVLVPPCSLKCGILPKNGWSFFLNVPSLCVVSYTTGHIWACPPSEGDDYIFHCHPPDQKIPKPKRLQEWYKKMLDKAVSERIVHDYKVRSSGGKQQKEKSCCLLTILIQIFYSLLPCNL